MKKITFLTCLFLLIILIAFTSCNKNNTIEPKKLETDIIVKEDSNGEFFELIMPDSLPDIISEKAFEIAIKNKFCNIRILEVKNQESPTYNIEFFDSYCNVLKSYNLSFNNQLNEIINTKDVTDFTVSQLNKANTSWVCWDLGKFSKNYPYSAPEYCFVQAAISYGWFTKLIYDLRCDQVDGLCGQWACEASWYLNDSISSNRWRDDRTEYEETGRIARPCNLRIYKNANFSGPQKTWSISKYKCLYPERSIDIVNYSNWQYDDGTNCNNSVTSIRFDYRVFLFFSDTCNTIG